MTSTLFCAGFLSSEPRTPPPSHRTLWSVLRCSTSRADFATFGQHWRLQVFATSTATQDQLLETVPNSCAVYKSDPTAAPAGGGGADASSANDDDSAGGGLILAIIIVIAVVLICLIGMVRLQPFRIFWDHLSFFFRAFFPALSRPPLPPLNLNTPPPPPPPPTTQHPPLLSQTTHYKKQPQQNYQTRIR